MPLIADISGVGHDAFEVTILDIDLVIGSFIEQPSKGGAGVSAIGQGDVAASIAVSDRGVSRYACFVCHRCALRIATGKFHVHQA